MKNESYEFIGEPDEAVGRLIAGLPRVEAPSDFEMRVRARIASGRKAGSSWLIPLVRIAVPAALLIAIGGYFGYYALYQNSPSANPAVVAVPEVKPAPQAETPTRDEVVAAVNTAPSPEVQEVGSESARQSPVPKRRTTDSGIDSADSALTQTEIITQPGRTNPSLQNLSPAEGGPGITPKDVLEQMGITASFTSDVWKVGAVQPNSMADKSGVKAGDIIEALNDQPLTKRTVLGRTFTGTSLRVRRDGHSIKLDLKH
jgi:membrane-associated protease RseP (regulator of RpoE activity)